MYTRTADQPVQGRYSASVYEKTRTGGEVVATFYSRDRETAERWANRFAAGSLDAPDAPTDPQPTPVDPAPPQPGPPASKAAVALAEANGVDLAVVHYSGKQITKPDVEAYILEHSRAGMEPADETDESPADQAGDDERSSPSDG